MNVLQLIDGDFLGGGHVHVILLSKRLKEVNSIIAGCKGGSFEKLIFENNLQMENICLRKRFSSKVMHQLIEIIEKNEIEIIHSHGTVAGIYSRSAKKRLAGVKVVHTIHGIHYTHSIFKKFIGLNIDRHLVPFTDKFICVSKSDNEMADKLKIIDPSKTEMVYNGIDLAKFKLQGTEKNENIVIGNVSRFDMQKNQKMIIQAASMLNDELPEIKFILAGNGKLLNKCKKMALELKANNVEFKGEVLNTAAFLKEIDIFVFPSLWEGLSIALIEAMASGKAIIASDIPPNRELITNDETGLLFDVNDLNALSDCIKRACADSGLRLKLGKAAAERANQFNAVKMADQIEKIYLSL